MIKVNETTITPTIFPDKTSQVWKLPSQLLTSREVLIEWDFEHESEILHLLQLSELIKGDLLIKYLPYGRQDKHVSNETTFALKTFVKVIETGNFKSITVVDPHNHEALPKDWIIHKPDNKIQTLVDSLNVSVCYPDKGAENRYRLQLHNKPIVANKIRNQITGDITNLSIDCDKITGDILIVDDICDGGRTFIETATLLYNAGASNVFLYTTHGIYSKGVEVLINAGIKRIFNFKGEVNVQQKPTTND